MATTWMRNLFTQPTGSNWRTVAAVTVISLVAVHRLVSSFRTRPSRNQKRRYNCSDCKETATKIEEVDEIVKRLKQEFNAKRTCAVVTPEKGKWDAEWREQQIYGIHDMIQEHTKELYDAACADLGKPYAEFVLEIGVMLGDIRGIIANIRTWMQPEYVQNPLFLQPSYSYIQHEPYSVALILSAWNFPLVLVIMPLCAALAAGNACLIKPSELSPAHSAFFQKYLPRYVDHAAIAVITGDVALSKKAVETDIDYCFFTGSARTGALIASSCASRHVAYSLELGGKSPVVIDRNCHPGVMARRVVQGKFMNGGQVCLSPDYVIVIGDDARAREVIFDAIIPEIQRQFGDVMLQPENITRVVSMSRFKRLNELLDEAKDHIVFGGKTDAARLLIEPTVFYMKDRDAAETLQMFQEEIFGPFMPVVNVPTVQDAVDFISKRPNPLALYVFSRDQSTIDTVLDKVNAGTGCVNDTIFQASNPYLPFGGTRQSGVGSYHGKWGFLQLSNDKSIMVRSEWLDSSLRYYPALREKNTQKIFEVALEWLL